jgi:hypothetical protein
VVVNKGSKEPLKMGSRAVGKGSKEPLMMAAWRWTKVPKNLDDDGGGGGQRYKRTFKNGQQGSGQRYKLTFTMTATTGSKEPDFVGDD